MYANLFASLLILIAAAALAACNSRESDQPAKTPLPTRQTTIDPVNKKLDTARENAERRRSEVDEAAK
jgi:hypothetical protein